MIKLYIIYGHVGLFIRASSSFKDDLRTTDIEFNSLATYQRVESSPDPCQWRTWPGTLQRLWAPPQPDATYFPGHWSSSKHHEPNCSAPSTRGGPSYRLSRTCDTRTADTLAPSRNTRRWSDGPCRHASPRWPRCKDSDLLKKTLKWFALPSFNNNTGITHNQESWLQIFVRKGNERVTPCVVSRGPRHGGGGWTHLPRPVKSICDRLTPATEVSVKVTFSVAHWKKRMKSASGTASLTRLL